ncbi:MAG: hypothetical protein H0W74_14055, partial [Sphingosinicella sp.]|nr:hypothetical protein [Sphingosinicella sp.]
MRHTSPAEIEHPEAYAAAIKRNIHGRANAKRFGLWKTAYPHLYEWYNFLNQQWDGTHDEESGAPIYTPRMKHPLGTFPAFARNSFEEWGAPSEKATAILQRIFDERTANLGKRAEERAAEAASA